MTTVEIRASKRYSIEIGAGLLSEAGERLRGVFAACQMAIVTDDIVDALYGDVVEESLGRAGFSVYRMAFPHGEANKTMDTLASILEFLGERQLGKADGIVALGGGVVGDTASLAAALYARGMRSAQLPTTLLAAVDSSVGGKTAVNLAAGKNMAGMFHQPSLVLCDTDVLRDLPADLRQDGVAEIVKYGVLADAPLLQQAEDGRLSEDWEGVVARCVSIKRDYVLQDELDEGKRRELNLGHTFGHAVETCSGYQISHGKAVGIGMMIVARAAERLGFAKEPLADRIERALSANGLPTECPFPADRLMQAALLDKKRRGDTIALIVPERVGQCRAMPMPLAEVEKWLKAGLEGGRG